MVQQIDAQAERARHDKRCLATYLQSTAAAAARSEEMDEINEKICFVSG
jgi:hypothetical protein